MRRGSLQYESQLAWSAQNTSITRVASASHQAGLCRVEANALYVLPAKGHSRHKTAWPSDCVHVVSVSLTANDLLDGFAGTDQVSASCKQNINPTNQPRHVCSQVDRRKVVTQQCGCEVGIDDAADAHLSLQSGDGCQLLVRHWQLQSCVKKRANSLLMLECNARSSNALSVKAHCTRKHGLF